MMKKMAGVMFGLFLVVLPARQSMAADVEKTIQSTVTVQAVDVPNRLLTVKDAAGTVQTLDVPASVKNLPQLKPGDRITTRYTESVAAEIRKPGEATKQMGVQESATTAPPGSKPGATAHRMMRTLITVKSVDTDKNMLTFEGPKSGIRTITVKDPKMQGLLKQLKPGDQVEVAYTEALAIDVQPAKQ